MGGKKKKYNARFPPARIKKIMQTDEEVGKIAAAVPVVISRALELFLESIITESVNLANGCNAKTLSSSHIKGVIQSNPAFDFLKTQVTLVPDHNADGADTVSTSALDRLNSLTRAGPAATSMLSAAFLSNSDSAQSGSTAAAKRRARPSASTVTQAEAEQADGTKPKRKRGRPPKIKQVAKPEEVKVEPLVTAQPMTSPVATAHTSIKSEQPSTNGELKEVKAEPSTVATTSIATPVPLASPPIAQAPSVQEVESDNIHTESIFTTNTMVGLPPTAKSGLQQQAHTASNVSRYYEPTRALNLSYSKGGLAMGAPTMYANLSPTSQPIDLSKKVETTRSYMPYPQSLNRNLNAASYLPTGNGGTLPTAHSAYSTPAPVADSDDYDA